MGSRVTSDEHLLSPLKYQPNSRHNCNTEKESDRQIYPTPALCFRFRCIIHLCANLEEPSQSPSQHQKEERSEKETGGLERKKTQRERRRRRKDRERERREENTRTKERGRQTQRKRAQEWLKLWAAMWWNIQTGFQMIQGDFSLYVFDIPSFAWLVCAEQINDDFHAKDS